MVEGLSDYAALVANSAPADRVVPAFAPGQSAAGDGGALSAIDERNHASGFSAYIRYNDAQGQASQRRITVRSVHPAVNQLAAWCHERLAPRIFRIDRIEYVARCETGEVIDVADWLRELTLAGVRSADPRLDQIIKVLAFLMHCDGSDHPFEHEAMESAITGFVLRFEGPDCWVDSAMALARRSAPDRHDFASALHWIARCDERPALARFLMPHAARIIEADGHIHANEVRFGHELDQLLKRMIDGQPRKPRPPRSWSVPPTE